MDTAKIYFLKVLLDKVQEKKNLEIPQIYLTNPGTVPAWHLGRVPQELELEKQMKTKFCHIQF